MTVSTVKDNLGNIQRFVTGNLASGADHMFVFLDQSEPEVEAWLAERDNVTTVVTDKSWWRGKRPGRLNLRQNINANLALAVAEQVGGVEWLFHVDADEVVRIDRDVLDQVPAEANVVNLRPLEVVGVLEPQGPPTLFKRLLDEGELQLAVALGLLEEPSNPRYFRSHIAGKMGVRPGTDRYLEIHMATDAEGVRKPAHRAPGLEMLHYEAYSGAEFVRKWKNMITSGPTMHFGDERMALATALKTLVELDLPADVKTRHLETFYQRHMADPVEELDSLGLLERIDPTRGSHRPEPLTRDQRDTLAAALDAIRLEDKRNYMPPRAKLRVEEKADEDQKTEPTAEQGQGFRKLLGRRKRIT
ncbi:glycosyltransferase family 2 protein [Nocardioides sp. JQ2195]|uniref:glycosyltransferase family 2 protein n=1 Tax=Nocardioides sp. JQ2195 TaxID=2592334 RepID=UPI0019812C69|nr:glycosyltransferase family 2 protein [Nocardioides sp. JQ2195]